METNMVKNPKLSTWDRAKACLLKKKPSEFVSAQALSSCIVKCYPEVSKDAGFRSRLRQALKKKVEEKVIVQKKMSFRLPAASRVEKVKKAVKKVVKKIKKPAPKKKVKAKAAPKKPAKAAPKKVVKKPAAKKAVKKPKAAPKKKATPKK